MKFQLAAELHDEPLRRLAREEAMPGAVRLAYTREPDWFAAQSVLGHSVQTVVGLDTNGEVVGAGVRAIRRVFVNGEPTDIGWLCGLRSRPKVRRGLGLAQGDCFFRKLHDADHATPAYLTTVLESNASALKIFATARAGLPTYHDFGRVNTYLWTHHLGTQASRLHIIQQPVTDRIIEFLNTEGAKKQFFPVIEKQLFSTPQWRDLHVAYAQRDNEIIGVVAVWDQRAFRQIRMEGYAPCLAFSRRAINAVSRISGIFPALPRAGATLNVRFAALVCIKDDDPHVFVALMRHHYRILRTDGTAFLTVSLHERSPLNAAFTWRDKLFNCPSRLCCVCWNDGEAFLASLDPTRIPHIEGGLL